MNKKYLEQASRKETSIVSETLVPLTPTGSKEKGKGKVVGLSPEVE